MADLPIPARVTVLERETARHETDIFKLEDRVDKTESRLDILGAKIGVYAALGSLVGGGIVAALLTALFHH